MSEPSIVAVAKLLIDLDIDSTSPVTLRVKPDRRKAPLHFQEAPERRLASTSARPTETAVRPAAPRSA